MADQYQHYPVLLKEVLDFLEPAKGKNFVDATLGGGSYSLALLEGVKPSGKVLSIDLDHAAIDNFQKQLPKDQTKQSQVAHGNFSDVDKIVVKHEFNNIDGIVADLGLSSYQIDNSGRGITFQKKEPLDMRFDQSQNGSDAKFILNSKTEAELSKIFSDYGEEKYSRQIARAVVMARQEKPFHYTTELLETITKALPKPVKHKTADSARRIFQALRIAVNHELESLENFLPKAFDLLSRNGVMVIVSFHSLEDRIVKQYFNGLAKGCVCPIDFPLCVCGKNPKAKVLTKKPITASADELNLNPRSKPAKLRAIKKL